MPLKVAVIDQLSSAGCHDPKVQPVHSIELAGAKVTLLFRHDDLDVLVSDIAVASSLSDASFAGGFSWHLVVEGRALFEQGDRGWEVLPAHSLMLEGAQPYRVVNPGGERLRLLSVVVGAAAGEPAAA